MCIFRIALPLVDAPKATLIAELARAPTHRDRGTGRTGDQTVTAGGRGGQGDGFRFRILDAGKRNRTGAGRDRGRVAT